MTILSHTVWKFLHFEVRHPVVPVELADSAASKLMQMHAEEIEVARRFWTCPFQSLSVSSPTEIERQSRRRNAAHPAL